QHGVTTLMGGGWTDDYHASRWYDLTSDMPSAMTPTDGRFTFPALSPDGAYVFTHAGNAAGQGGDTSTQLYRFSTAAPGVTAVATTGLPEQLEGAMPIFSPDGKHVGFNYYSDAAGNGDTTSLAMLDFDMTMKAFSGMQTVVYRPAGSAVWASFLPTGTAVVYELETARSRSWELGAT